MQNIEELLQVAVEDHLKKYCYSNYEVFSEGCRPLEERRVASIEAHPPYYCYQHNECILHTLIKAGVESSCLERRGALVVNKFDGEQDEKSLFDTMMPHSVVIVDNAYLVDVGFGGNSLRGPLPFRRLEEEILFHCEFYRFKRCDEFRHNSSPPLAEWWGVMIRVDSRWFELWRFQANVTLDREGLEQMNRDLFLAPQEVNIRDVYLLVGRVLPTKRVYLCGRKVESKPLLKSLELTSVEGCIQQKITHIDCIGNLEDSLKEEFDFPLPPQNVLDVLYFGQD
jgi:hypothetical protein